MIPIVLTLILVAWTIITLICFGASNHKMKAIKSQKEFDSTLATPKAVVVVHFGADFATECSLVDEQFQELEKEPEFSKVIFTKVAAEDLADVSLRYSIEAAPTVVIFRKGKPVDRVVGLNPPDVLSKVRKHVALETADIAIPEIDSSSAGDAVDIEAKRKEALDTRLKALIKHSPVMLFMKGSPDTPRCGFSRQMCSILAKHNAKFGHFDILTDEDVRQGLKKFSNWPTYPQLYVNGELLGGVDIIREMDEANELADALK